MIQFDVAHADVQKLTARVFGDPTAGVLADGKKLALRVVRRAESFGSEGTLRGLQRHRHARTADRRRTTRSRGCRLKGSHGRFTPSRRRSMTRSSRERRKRSREFDEDRRTLEAGAFGGVRRVRPGRASVRLFILPSADSRRVLEEMVPRFPTEVGGGPITDLTNGLIWAAAGDRERAKSRRSSSSPRAAILRPPSHSYGLAENVVAFLRRSPEVQKAIPDLARVLPDFKPTVVENRVTLAVDAQQAAALADALVEPGATSGHAHSVRQQLEADRAGASQLSRQARYIFRPHIRPARTASRS